MTECNAPDDAVGFVERMGLFWEAEGFPRIAGRIFGFLFLQPDACSLDELADALAVSKASVSTDARRLEQYGLLERQSRPGDRRDYYGIAPDVTARMVAMRRERIARFRDMLACDATAGALHPVVRDRLRAMDVVHRHLDTALDAILRELESEGLASTAIAPNHATRS